MKILITGHMGFLGSHLVPRLEALGHTIDGIDSQNGGNIFHESTKERVQAVDVVYHLAAETDVEESIRNPRDVFYTNIIGSARIIDYCKRFDKKLIFPSSAAIYSPFSSPYAKSKIIIEDVIEHVLNSYVILRLFNVYGKGMKNSVMRRFSKEDPLVVYGGEQTRDFIHIDDVIGMMVAALDESWNKHTVDVGTGVDTSIQYLAELFSKIRNVPIHNQDQRSGVLYSKAKTMLREVLYQEKLVTNLEEDIKQLL